MAGYVIAIVDVTNAEEYQAYSKQVPATIAKYGGRYRVRGGKTEVREGEWPATRTVILEFPRSHARWSGTTRPNTGRCGRSAKRTRAVGSRSSKESRTPPAEVGSESGSGPAVGIPRPLRRPPRPRRRAAGHDPLRRAGGAAPLDVPFDRLGPRRVRSGHVEHRPRPLHGVDDQPRALRAALIFRRPLLAGAAAARGSVRAVPAPRDADRRADDLARARRVADLSPRAPLPCE